MPYLHKEVAQSVAQTIVQPTLIDYIPFMDHAREHAEFNELLHAAIDDLLKPRIEALKRYYERANPNRDVVFSIEKYGQISPPGSKDSFPTSGLKKNGRFSPNVMRRATWHGTARNLQRHSRLAIIASSQAMSLLILAHPGFRDHSPENFPALGEAVNVSTSGRKHKGPRGPYGNQQDKEEHQHRRLCLPS
ncbi:hypothetical protein BCR34DRAFT_595067 [Clohesyomyces aquaticus]|uniref:Uncharacterized protein n=1 Tax=Clohesyomyces aquaticus TaxID=1231657 RepID=A0A1Y1XYU9_9PLEO|nr:hypothetical protein BCR34DRAFT_595067 [Clohesyomyces aquaticus]